MIFTHTPLAGAYQLDIEKRSDDRGFFARAWCRNEFAARGLATDFVQSNVSFNPERGTLRGLHWQEPPHGETKLIRCVRGAIYDVIVDLRPGSSTFRHWFAAELTADSRRMLYVPERFAHGFQTLAPDTEVTYMVSAFYAPAAARGLRFDDPVLNISWPLPVTRISAADKSWPLIAREAA